MLQAMAPLWWFKCLLEWLVLDAQPYGTGKCVKILFRKALFQKGICPKLEEEAEAPLVNLTVLDN